MTARTRCVAIAVTSVACLTSCAELGRVTIVSSSATASASATTSTSTTVANDTVVTTTTSAPNGEFFDEFILGDVVDLGSPRTPADDDGLVAAAVADISSWSAEVLASMYDLPQRALDGKIYAGRLERTTALPGCGSPSTDYSDLVEYVALYCPGDEFVVYDDGPDGLLGSLVAEHGGTSIAVVLAHEFGHFIQDRAGILDLDLPTVTTEQQADCFAGAWMGRVTSGTSPTLTLGDDGVRTGLIALVQVRDPAGVDTMSPGGHGTAFDRVGAYQLGFEEGPAACAALIDNPLPLMPNAYLSYDDYLRGGDAPYDCAGEPNPDCRASWEFLGDDLNEFWTLILDDTIDLTALPVDDLEGACPDFRAVDGPIGRCVNSGLVVFDELEVLDLYSSSGDFTLGYLLGLAWADAALERQGSSSATDRLRADCLVGAWVDDITLGLRRDQRRISTVTSSPGDPDEAISMLIRLSDTGDEMLFDRVGAFRTGVLNGRTAC